MKAKLKTKKKPLTVSQAKKKAWAVFSQYIRQKYAREDGQCQCVTCNKWDHWTHLQAGHFIDGRNNTVLYDERLVHPQCFNCNMKLEGCKAGNKVVYSIFMMKKYNLTVKDLEDMQNLYFSSKQMKAQDHLEIFEAYKIKLKEVAK